MQDSFRKLLVLASSGGSIVQTELCSATEDRRLQEAEASLVRGMSIEAALRHAPCVGSTIGQRFASPPRSSEARLRPLPRMTNPGPGLSVASSV
jgi:hypothetical protein